MDVSLVPRAVALLTRYEQPELDYRWYINIGEPSLFEQMQEIYQRFIADRGGTSLDTARGEIPLLCLTIGQEGKENRIAILIGAMPTARKDYKQRIIYDTLYLEFDIEDKKEVLSSLATLFYAYDNDKAFAEYTKYEKSFLAYAEEGLFSQYDEKNSLEAVPQIMLEWDSVPVFEQDESWTKPKWAIGIKPEVAVRSSSTSREKCARYLKKLADAETESEPLILFSTGRVGIEQLQQYANEHTGIELIFLTLSESVKGEQSLLKNKDVTGVLQNIADDPQGSIRRILGLGMFLLMLGASLYATTLDRLPPQLVSLSLPLAASAAVALPIGETTSDVFTIPRFGELGSLRLTFDENREMAADVPPRLSISEGAQALSFAQPCTSSDKEAKVWDCPLVLSSDEANREDNFTLMLSDVEDKAGNSMEPETLSFPLRIESAEIQGAFVGTLRILRKEELPFVAAQIKASAKYGIESVKIGGAEAAFDSQKDLWQAEVPLQDVLDSGKPLIATVRDIYGNELDFSL